MKLRLALSAATVLLAWPAAAAAQNIAVDADDKPVKISGFIGDPAGFARTMRLTANGKVGTFRTLFSDLSASNDRRIDRSNLSLVGATAMDDGDIIDVEVKVEGVADPGTFKGQVELIPVDQKRSAGTTVPIELVATARPVLTAVTNRDKVSGNLTKCGPLGCGITGFLVGDAGNKKRSIEFTLGKGQKATVTGIDPFVDGVENEHQASAAELGLPKTVDEAAGVLRVPTEIDVDALEPDHYTGSVHLAVDGVDAPAVVPVDFTVRAEPLLAIAAIVLGLLVGVFSKFFRGRGTELLGLYVRADTLERRLVGSSVGDKAPIQDKIDLARAAIGSNDAEGAKNLLDGVEKDLTDAGVPLALPAAPGATGTAPKVPFYRKESFLRFMSWVAAAAVMVVIVVTGFQTQYVDKGTTFGAGNFWDYLALAAWGFAAGLAGKAVASAGTPSGTG